MSPRLPWWVARAVLRDTLLALLGLGSLVVGLDLASGGYEGAFLAGAAHSLARAAPALPAPVAFLGATFAIGRLERERALAALAAHGVSMRRTGAWVLVAGLPAAIAAVLLSAFPPLRGETPRDDPRRVPARLSDGGLLVETGGERALVLAGDTLLVGPALVADRQVRLEVEERWELGGGRPARTRVAAPETWSGERLGAPPSLARRDAPLDARTLLEWSAREPGRRDLAHARLALLAAGPRVLALLLLGLGFWLRPRPGGYAGRALAAAAAALLFTTADLACASMGQAGVLAPATAAFGPTLLAAALGAAALLRCDRPSG